MMIDSNFHISICIPAYKNTTYLKRLLQSISIQTFKHFEVVVSDDSNDDSVSKFINNNNWNFSINYIKNDIPLGTPENWNNAIRNAKGDWIKIMHDDDWFAHENSLQKFASAIKVYPHSKFIFSAYNNVYEATGITEPVVMNNIRKKWMLKNPVTLISNNIIGPPSVTMHKNSKDHWYDKNVKWVVDMDFYIRFLTTSKPCFIDEHLVNVGVNKNQVTQYTFGVPEVHLRENFYLLNKVGEKNLQNIIVFDAWWRLLRNFSVKNVSYIREIGYDGIVPSTIIKMVSFQKKIPSSVLKLGFLSKVFMSICFLSIKTR